MSLPSPGQQCSKSLTLICGHTIYPVHSLLFSHFLFSATLTHTGRCLTRSCHSFLSSFIETLHPVNLSKCKFFPTTFITTISRHYSTEIEDFSVFYLQMFMFLGTFQNFFKTTVLVFAAVICNLDLFSVSTYGILGSHKFLLFTNQSSN